MSPAGEPLHKDIRRVLFAQAVLVVVVAAGFGVARGGFDALSALYGGAVTIGVTTWLGRRLQRVGGPGDPPGAGLLALFSSFVVRYAAVIVLLGLGLGVLTLAPLPLLAAFAATQFGYLVNLRHA